jgi:geranylgeranyl pyrophosphate synthase
LLGLLSSCSGGVDARVELADKIAKTNHLTKQQIKAGKFLFPPKNPRKFIAIEQNQDLPNDVFQQILSAVQNSGALDYTQATAKREVDLALECLKEFPQNEATTALHALSTYSLSRQT